jgi:hypothetical protein
MRKGLGTVFILSIMAAADTVVPRTAAETSITIYNNNLAFVHERRETEVSKGRQKIIYEGVADSVITPSVIPAFSGMATQLFSQNYIYDLVSLSSMLRHSVGHEVDFYTNGENPSLSEGTLLAWKPSVMIRRKDTGKIITLDKASQVVFRGVPPNMITRPSLIWEIETEKAGRLGIDLKYLTGGFKWKSDYVLNLAKKNLELTGWITVDNHSGVTYPNARITCLAGNIHKVRQERRQRGIMYKNMMAGAMEEVKEEAFSGYHIYKIPFRETLADKQQKQIRFIRKEKIGYRQYGKAVIRSFPREGQSRLAFRNMLEIDNTEANGLGIPLPAGTVRMYGRDSGGESHFIGESRIDNTPADETLRLHIGTLFDVTGEKKIIRYVARKGYRNVKTTYTLHNRGETSLILKIEERIPTSGGIIKLKTSCNGICSVKKPTAFIREFTVVLPSKGEYEFSSEFEVWN